MATKIAVLSQKGGTGKTTAVRTLTDVMRLAGLKVLAVDLDPQGNLSDYFDVDPQADPTIGDVLAGRASAKQAVHDDLMPANLTLAEAELTLAGKMGRELTLRKALFYDNEHGVLATNDDKAELLIESSIFGRAPKVVGGLHHLLNIGRIGKLSITGSRFQQGFEGHLIRSRAREAVISYNFIHDGVRGGASYEIELAAGGLATVIGNVIGQGVDGQNPVLLAYGTEGRAWDRNELYVAHNTFVHYGWLPAWFMRVFDDRVGADTKVFAVNNLLVGPGVFWLAASGDFAGNRHATRGMLQDIWTNGLELPPGAMWRGSGVDPKRINGRDLSPKAEFEWPVGTRAIAPLTNWTPGAYQR